MPEQANGPQEVQQMTQTLRCNVVRARKMAHLSKRTRQAPPEAPTWDAAYAVVMACQQVCRKLGMKGSPRAMPIKKVTACHSI